MTPVDDILIRQAAWAEKRGIRCVGPGPCTVAENLLRSMHPATLAEFAAGDGEELGAADKPGKMRSLRSSSALAVNVFEFWRYRPLRPLSVALGLHGEYVELHFEQKLPTGLRGKRPNVDVMLFQKSGPPAGIECKFCEPYDARNPHEALDAVYLPGGDGLWAKKGLSRLEGIARDLGHSYRPVHLGVGQLLKHTLGLSHTFPALRPIQLVYLWFDDGSAMAREHNDEVREFARRVAGDLTFRSLTYQELHKNLKANGGVDQEYLDDISTRYFAT